MPTIYRSDFENMKVAPSPKWMQERLLVCGIKPINNIVDITNYVMLETGQPLHAFDAAKLITRNTKHEIIVRRAKKGEKIKLLDEKVYELNENNLVIADSEKALALAGVMGGFDSSINSKTTSVIFESANFNSTNIRKTRTAHNIITESSHRFERDIDPNLAEAGMARAIELFREICGKNSKIAAFADAYAKKIKPWQIKLNTDYASRLLGEKIPASTMKKILENLGIGVKIAKNILNCEIPTRRIDLKTQEDLVEEIGRIYGYENIKEQAPIVEVKNPPQNAKRDFENKLRDILVGLGFSEVMNYAFYGKEDIEKCNLKIEDHIEVANPLSLDQQYLRANLAPNVLKNINLNLKNYSEVSIFEIGKEFRKAAGKLTKEENILDGSIANSSAAEPLFSLLKGKVEILLKNINIKDVSFAPLNGDYKFWHQSRSAGIFLNKEKIGKIGEINPTVLKRYGIKQRVAMFGLKIEKIMNISKGETIFQTIPKYPLVMRDISMFVDGSVKYSDIEKKIRASGEKSVFGVELFDVFEKEDKKSLALRVKIGSDAKTLTSEEIDAVMKKIISALEKDLKVKVRK